MNSQCILCLLERNAQQANTLGDEKQATAFMRDLLQMYLDAPDGASSPYLGPKITSLYEKHFGLTGDRYKQEKEQSNAFVLERLPQLRAFVKEAKDPLLAAIQLSILGNYLDFAALKGNVSFEKLDEYLLMAADMQLDPDCYAQLKKDLSKAKRLLYITDNAGEIGFDRVLAETIRRLYPDIQITFCVRGQITQNDATREDAAAVGIDFPIVDNGNAVAGTELSLLSAEAKQALESADVIYAKGMGNTETMYGCGYNVYYAFLIKCQRFVSFFGKELMTPMLVKE